MNGNQVTSLVRRAREGDCAAWELLYEEYSRLLWGVARRFRLDDHQRADAVQTTWLRLLESVDDIRDPARLPGWLATTVRRTCSASPQIAIEEGLPTQRRLNPRTSVSYRGSPGSTLPPG